MTRPLSNLGLQLNRAGGAAGGGTLSDSDRLGVEAFLLDKWGGTLA
jgi:hypothetical protein